MDYQESEDSTTFDETRMGDEKNVQKHWLQRAEEYLTNVYVRVLEETAFAPSFACTLLVVSFLQLLELLLTLRAAQYSEDRIQEYLRFVLSFFTVYQFGIEVQTVLWYYAMVYGLFLLLILYIVLILIIAPREIKTTYIKLTQLVSVLTVVIYWILMLPILHLSLAIFRCKASGYTLVDPTLVCWSGVHIVHMVILSLCIACLVGIVLLIALFANESDRFCPANPFARFAWHFETYYAIYRLVLPVFLLLAPVYSLMYYAALITLLGGAWVLVYFYRAYLPYYNQDMGMSFVVCVSSLLWFSLLLAFNELLQAALGTRYEGTLLPAVAGCAGIIPAVMYYHHRNRLALLRVQDHLKIDTEQQFNRYINGLLSLVVPNAPLTQAEEMLLEGYVATHKAECVDVHCPLKGGQEAFVMVVQDRSDNEQKMGIDHAALLYLVKHIYDTAFARSQAHTNLFSSTTTTYTWLGAVVSRAYFLVHRIGNLHLAAVEFSKIMQSEPSLALRVSVAKGKRMLCQIHEGRNRKKVLQGLRRVTSIDPRLLLEYEAKFLHFKNQTLRFAETYRELWRQLKLAKPDLNVAIETTNKMMFYRAGVRTVWDQLRHLHLNHSKAEGTYTMFLTYVLGHKAGLESNGQNRKKRKMKGAGRKGQHTANKVIFSKDTAIVVMSAMPETFGKILKASNGVTKLFEYSPSDLIGRNVTTLMPPFIAAHHAHFVKDYLKSGRKDATDTEFVTFAADRGQYIFQIKLMIREYYDLTHQSIFAGLIHAYPARSLIVTNEKGLVLGISRDTEIALGATFSPTSIHENEIHLQTTCPKIPWDLKSPEEGYKQFVGERRVMFKIPNTLQTSTRRSNKQKDTRGNSSMKSTQDIIHERNCDVINMAHREIQLKLLSFRSETHFDNKSGDSDLSLDQLIIPITGTITKRQHLSAPISSMEIGVLPDEEEDKNTNKGDKPEKAESSFALKRLQSLASYIKKPPIPNGAKEATLTMPKLKPLIVTTTKLATLKGTARGTTTSTTGVSKKEKEKEKEKEREKEKEKEREREREKKSDSKKGKDKDKDKASNKEIKDEKKEAKEGGKEEDKEERELDEDSENEEEKKQEDVTEIERRTKAISKEMLLLHKVRYQYWLPTLVRYVLRCSLFQFVLCILCASMVFAGLMVAINTMKDNYSLVDLERGSGILQIVEAVRTFTLSNSRVDGVPMFDINKRNVYGFGAMSSGSTNNKTNGTTVAGNNYTEWKLNDIRMNAKILINIQNTMSRLAAKFYLDSNRETVNPRATPAHYRIDGVPSIQHMYFVSVVMTFANQALKIAAYRIESIVEGDETVDFIVDNGYQGLQASIAEAVVAILEEVRYIEIISEIIAQYGCVVVCTSAGLWFIVMLVLWIRLNRLNSDNARMLLQIKRSELKSLLELCNKYIQFIHADTGTTESATYTGEESDAESGDEKEEDAAQLLRNFRNQARIKRHIPYRGTYLSNISGFGLTMCALCGCFWLFYFVPPMFFSIVNVHLREVQALRSFHLDQLKLYAFTLELLSKKSTTQIEAQSIAGFLSKYIQNMYDRQDVLLSVYRSNRDTFSSDMQTSFDMIMFNNMCTLSFVVNMTECQSIFSGTLLRGIYASNIHYISYFRDVLKDYEKKIETELTLAYLQSVINKESFVQAELLVRKYISMAMSILSNKLQDSILFNITTLTSIGIGLVFGLYVLVIVLYLIPWIIYIRSLRHNLLNARLTLCNLPINVILSTQSICDYFFIASHETQAELSLTPAIWIAYPLPLLLFDVFLVCIPQWLEVLWRQVGSFPLDYDMPFLCSTPTILLYTLRGTSQYVIR